MSDPAQNAELLTQSETRWSDPPLQNLRQGRSKDALVAALARSFLAGESTREQIVARAERTLGKSWRWLAPLVQRYLESTTGRPRNRHREVVLFLLSDPGFGRACLKHSGQLSVAEWLTPSQEMQPVGAAAAWELPGISSAGALAEWLQLRVNELEWFADLKGLGYKNENSLLRHYRYRTLRKSSGNIRLIEAPKQRLKELQRTILAEILKKIPPHEAAHGFRKARSILTFVAPHAAQNVVLRMDLRDFFPSFSGVKIQAFFRTAGYPESVADLLGGICTNAAPRDSWSLSGIDIDARKLSEAQVLYSRPHLPQGAPTSPALANLCFYRTDCRLSGLAQAAGAQYTRYADDLAFSGGPVFEARVERFATHAAAILLEEGFPVLHRKTRIMRRSVRQHLAGLVINQHANVMRHDLDVLKATLTNCVRFGPETQNRGSHAHFRLHLEGRVAFVEMVNAERGKRLRAILDQVEWRE